MEPLDVVAVLPNKFAELNAGNFCSFVLPNGFALLCPNPLDVVGVAPIFKLLKLNEFVFVFPKLPELENVAGLFPPKVPKPCCCVCD